MARKGRKEREREKKEKKGWILTELEQGGTTSKYLHIMQPRSHRRYSKKRGSHSQLLNSIPQAFLPRPPSGGISKTQTK